MSGVGPFGNAGKPAILPNFITSPAARANNVIEKAGNVAGAAQKAVNAVVNVASKLTEGGKRKLKKNTRHSNRKRTRRNKTRSNRKRN